MNLFATVVGVFIDLFLKLNISKIKTVFTLFIFVVAGLVKSYDTLYERYFGGTQNTAGTVTRKAFYVYGWENFKHHKFTGLGTNLYTARSLESEAVREGVLESTMFDRESRTSPHGKLKKHVKAYLEFRRRNGSERPHVTGVIESYWILCLVEYGLVAFIP